MLYIRKRLLSFIVVIMLVLSYGTGVFAQGEEPAPTLTPIATENLETPVPTELAQTLEPETPAPATPVPTEGSGATPTPDIEATPTPDVGSGDTPAEPSIHYGEISDALPFGGLNGTQLELGGRIRTFAAPSIAVPSINVTISARIADTMENYGTIVNLSDLNLPNDDAMRATINTCLTAVVNSYPQYFYYGFTYKTVGYPNLMLRIELTLSRSEEVARAQRAELMSAISAALENVIPASATMTITEKALALHDYLLVHNRYYVDASSNTTPDAFNAYGALVKGNSVCQGIASAYKALLQAIGINTYVVTSDNINHAWNLVETEYGWYHVDVTWDDPLHSNEYNGDMDWMGYGSHDNFMMTDAQLNANHFSTQKPNDVEVQITSGTAPEAATASHPYSDFWQYVEGSMFYDAGYWYYNDGTKLYSSVAGRYITIGNLKKTIFVNAFDTGSTIAGNATFAASDGGSLYYFDHGTLSIKRYSLKSADTVELINFSTGEVISELGIGPINLYAAGNPEGSLVSKQQLLYILHSGGATSVLTFALSPAVGDLNRDGRINEMDALLICGFRIGIALTEEQLTLADANNDGIIDLSDALLICR